MGVAHLDELEFEEVLRIVIADIAGHLRERVDIEGIFSSFHVAAQHAAKNTSEYS